jgi:hypothetical protein
MTTPENIPNSLEGLLGALNGVFSELTAYESVSGHLYDQEARTLQFLAAGKTVLDIGTHHGRSAVAMAATAKRVVTVDNYLGDSQIRAPDIRETLENISRSGLGDKITPVVADWTKWIAGPVDLEAYDMLFYDAGHTFPIYEKHFLALCDDFTGIIALHDYKTWDDDMRFVVEAVDDFERATGRKRQGPLPKCSVVWFNPVQ